MKGRINFFIFYRGQVNAHKEATQTSMQDTSLFKSYTSPSLNVGDIILSRCEKRARGIRIGHN